MPFVSEMLSCAISLLQFIYLVLCNAWALQGREFLMLQTAVTDFPPIHPVSVLQPVCFVLSVILVSTTIASQTST